MWDWLKKKSPPTGEMKAYAKQWIGPQALSVALARTVQEYVAAVQVGELSYPAHRREGASVVEIWADLRIEACHKLFNFGQSDPYLLSDQRRQEELLACFLEEKPHLEMPQPRGAVIPDTIQGMFQVYLYLDAAGSEVADRETDRLGLQLKGKSILDRIESECAEVWPRWIAFWADGTGGVMPSTMIELVYTDVTDKAKSIALSTRFGPHIEGGIKYMEDLLVKKGEDPTAFRASVDRVIAATDPDQLTIGRR